MKKVIQIFLIFVMLLGIGIAGFLLIASKNDYRPKEVHMVADYEFSIPLMSSDTFSILSWNIGYAGLGEKMDFFYDGGKHVRDIEDNVRRNLYMLCDVLKDSDTVDFMLLQEVDSMSKRTYQINQLEWLENQLPYFFSYFAVNYKVPYVPVPIKSPMGNVNSGLLTFSRELSQRAYRYSYPENFSWPQRIFILDRCFLTNIYLLDNGKKFILINTHHSAFDDGTLRAKQNEYLANYIQNEYSKGNYVLVGGDWNQCPPEFKPRFTNQLFDTVSLMHIPKGYPGDKWSFHFDRKVPTNRRTTTPYNREKSLTTVLDYYLASPNIEVLETKTMDLQF
ncbi:MAG: endonuclease/exonuclease/phosphatase family protein, partial [Bacteroidales bacterium]|nr:endonuclease/exonuclease/phosphatase family protein [Bacteroidales bacterium]